MPSDFIPAGAGAEAFSAGLLAAARLLPPLTRLLRPLVSLLIRAGITFPVLSDLLRQLYVEVAAAELDVAGPSRRRAPAARNDSRLSLITGLHRKEIRRLRALQTPAGDVVPAVVTLHSQLIARWLGGADTADAAGRPLPLPRLAAGDATGGPPSFERLVRGVTTDLRPRSVLDEWLSQGIAALGDDDTVRLLDTAYVPRPGQDAQLFYFARNLHDHLAAAAANVLARDAAPFLERSVHYDALSPDLAARLIAGGGAAAERLLLDINRLALALLEQGGEPPPGAPTARVNLGVYLFHEPEPAQPLPATPGAGP